MKIKVDSGIPLRFREQIARQFNGHQQTEPVQPPKANRKTVVRTGPRWKALPLDQRMVSYPLAWGRDVLKIISYVLSVLSLPSWLVYHAAMGFNWTGANYPHIRSFAIAHAAGWVRRAAVVTRREACTGCQYHYTFRDEHSYCKGDNQGRGCGCGHWKLSRLTHKLRLSGWCCPQDKFGYGTIGRLQRRIMAAISRSKNNGD